MVAAAKIPSMFSQLNAFQVADIRAQLVSTAGKFKGVKKTRILRVANDNKQGPLRQKAFAAFIDRAYQRHLEDGGHSLGSKASLSVPAFVTSLLDWIKNNPEAVMAFITLIVSLFGI